jgi:RNA polymerase sigma-70 factor (ECF subfamily)
MLGHGFGRAMRLHEDPAITGEFGSLALGDLERVYRAHRNALLRVAQRLVGVVEAESVIQEVFVELLRNAELRARFVGGSLGAWLSEIARRKGLEYLRRHGREIPSEAAQERGGPSPEPHLVARQLVERFVVAHVPEAQRRFFMLRFVEHRTQVEAAAAVGLPRSTVEGWEHRLVRALRRFILEDG